MPISNRKKLLMDNVSLADGSRIFSVTYNIVGLGGTQTQLTLTDDPTSRSLASAGGAGPEFISVDGSLAVVPEPQEIAWVTVGALSVFALLRRRGLIGSRAQRAAGAA